MKNKYTLSVLIPMYKEGEEVVKPLLDSIALQQNIDFDEVEAVITHDGIIPEDADYRLSEEFINSYPFDVIYLEMEHGGVSACRNYCLDHCNGKYVMFCDDDDMLYNMCGFWIVFREIENGGFDSLVSAFVEETRNPQTKEVVYVNHDMDTTFVHGKIHKRDFLVKNKIRWNNKLTIHEDSYFNCLCQRISGQKKDGLKYCQTPFYLWRWRDNSVCRHDPLYLNKTYRNMLESNTALVKEFLNRKMEKEAIFYATSMIMDVYLSLNTDRWWDEAGHEYLLPTEQRFKQYWKEFKYLYKKISKEEELQIMAGIRQRFFGEGLVHEKITFDDWIKHIEELEEPEEVKTEE